jgi:hypothetical protein
MKECLLTPLGNQLEISTKRVASQPWSQKSEFYMIRNVDASGSGHHAKMQSTAVGNHEG